MVERMPRRYSECLKRYADGVCPWAGCPHNLMVDVTEAGSLVLNYPGSSTPVVDRRQRRRAGVIGREIATTPKISAQLAELVAWWAGKVTCERFLSAEAASLDELADRTSLTHQRVTQVEQGALAKLRPLAEALGLRPEPVRDERRRAAREAEEAAEAAELLKAAARQRDYLARVSLATTVYGQPTDSTGVESSNPAPEGTPGDVGVCGDDTREATNAAI